MSEIWLGGGVVRWVVYRDADFLEGISGRVHPHPTITSTHPTILHPFFPITPILYPPFPQPPYLFPNSLTPFSTPSPSPQPFHLSPNPHLPQVLKQYEDCTGEVSRVFPHHHLVPMLPPVALTASHPLNMAAIKLLTKVVVAAAVVAVVAAVVVDFAVLLSLLLSLLLLFLLTLLLLLLFNSKSIFAYIFSFHPLHAASGDIPVRR